MNIPITEWTFLGSSLNCHCYQVREDLIALVPFKDIRETRLTARANLDFQKNHWEKIGHGGGSLIFMDSIIEQDGEARETYASESGKVGTLCFALIGESLFASTTSVVYTGLARPSVPIRVFRSLEDALPWIDETIATTTS